MDRDRLVHLFAGAMGGTAGAIVTCPLEVVKTRRQSSIANYHIITVNQQPSALTSIGLAQPPAKSMGIWRSLNYIWTHEGAPALWKGLGPNLVGVAPSRAFYFLAYSTSKNWLNARVTERDSAIVHLGVSAPDSTVVHILSAFTAGFLSCTITNPIWLIKTRVQLDRSRAATGAHFTVFQCIKLVYKERGLKGFYKGMTASYYGISETVLHFVIYEALKKQILRRNEEREGRRPDQKAGKDYFMFMAASSCSKLCASSMFYPHEVARTRLREPGRKYRRFWQTLNLVLREEGYRGLYRGFGTHLIRQVPNTAIMMSVYELLVYNMGGRTEAFNIYRKHQKPAKDLDLPNRGMQLTDSRRDKAPSASQRCVTVSAPGTKPSPPSYSSLPASAEADASNGVITVSTETTILPKDVSEEAKKENDLWDDDDDF